MGFITDELTKLRKDVESLKKNKKKDTKKPLEAEAKKKIIKTLNNPELADVPLPFKIKTKISTYNISWLWTGGVFSLDRKVKAELKKDSEGKMKVYLKAKMTVSQHFYFFFDILP